MTKTRAAAVQVGSRLFYIPATLALFETKRSEVAGRGADLAVFPEAFLGGYPKGIDFGVRVGMRSADGREQYRIYFDNALERDSKEITHVCALVKDANINVVLGLIERAGGTLYCVSAVIDRQGKIVAWHRKLMPTAMERVIWGQGDGSTMNVAQTDIGHISTAICWENYMPLYRSHLYAQGTQIHCTPTVDDRDVWRHSMQMIALEGRCFVVSACQFMRVGDVAADWYNPIQGQSADSVLINGGSCIISPMGEVLAAPVFGSEAIVMAELDMDDITRGKFDLDIAGHYARPDVFQLNVNKAPNNT